MPGCSSTKAAAVEAFGRVHRGGAVILVMAAVVCAVLLLLVVQFKRARDRSELEQHSIAPEDLHRLLASSKDVALFDVRLPLDLLGNSVLIPGATRLAPEEVMANPSLIPMDRDAIVYCTCPSDETSRAVLHRAMAKGFLRIRFLKGGLEGWKSSGYPVVPYDKPFHLNSRGDNAALAS
jgi:rhodanese-related sulfurtransferase